MENVCFFFIAMWAIFSFSGNTKSLKGINLKKKYQTRNKKKIKIKIYRIFFIEKSLQIYLPIYVYLKKC